MFMPLLYPNQTRAMLFYGPPGTGKTMLARATAYEMNQYNTSSLRVLFYAPTTDQFKGRYVGETEAKIVRLFRCASQQARDTEQRLRTSGSGNATTTMRVRSIIFIDEIDSLARRRDIAHGSGGSIVASATNTLLQVMDGIQSYENVIVIAATNYPWNIDSAVLRRFSQKVYVPLPDTVSTTRLLQHVINQRVLHGLTDHSVNQRARSSTAHPSSVEFTTSETHPRELFLRLYPLHSIREEDVKIIASEMVSSSGGRAGYAPRDVYRLCDAFFKHESTLALRADRFYPIQLQPEYKNHVLHTEQNDTILRAVKGHYVSAQTYTRLRSIFDYAIVDVDDRFTSVNAYHNIPRTITETTLQEGMSTSSVVYTLHTASMKSEKKPSSPASSSSEVFPPYYVYWDNAHTTFVLHRSFKMFVRRTTHFVPCFLKGRVDTMSKTTTPIHTWEQYTQHVKEMFVVFDGRLYNLVLDDIHHHIIREHWMDVTYQTVVVDTTKGWLEQWTSYLSLLVNRPKTAPPQNVENDIQSIMNYLVKCSARKTHHKTPTEITRQRTFTYETTKKLSKPIPCSHLTFSIQHLLDQLRIVPPSSPLQTIRALEVYHQTGEEPSDKK
jgi:hypothetical protein